MHFYKRWNNITGWAVFAVAAMVYLMTMEPVSSLWDCSEFIATSYKLEVGHPPGAPLFMMLARLATLFAFGNPDYVGIAVNAMNSLASAFCILFLFWTITHLARRLVTRDGAQLTARQHMGRPGRRSRRGPGLHLHRHVLVLGRRGRGLRALVDVHGAGRVADAQMGGAGRRTPLLALDRADRLPDGTLDRRAHPQPADCIPALVFIYYFRKTATVTWRGIALLDARVRAR